LNQALDLTPLFSVELQIWIGDRIDLDHASSVELDRVRKLYLPHHVGPFRAGKIGEMRVRSRTGFNEGSALDVAGRIQPPHDLSTLVVDPRWFPVGDNPAKRITLTHTHIGRPHHAPQGAVCSPEHLGKCEGRSENDLAGGRQRRARDGAVVHHVRRASSSGRS